MLNFRSLLVFCFLVFFLCTEAHNRLLVTTLCGKPLLAKCDLFQIDYSQHAFSPTTVKHLFARNHPVKQTCSVSTYMLAFNHVSDTNVMYHIGQCFILPEIHCLTSLSQADTYLIFTILCLTLTGTSNSRIFSTPLAISFVYITSGQMPEQRQVYKSNYLTYPKPHLSYDIFAGLKFC